MKKVFLVVGIAALLLGCAGCSLIDKTAGPPASASPSASASASETPAAGDTASPDTSSDPGSDPSASPETSSDSADASPDISFTPPDISDTETDFAALGQSLMTSDGIGAVKIGMTESDLTKALGEPSSKSDPEVWGADGLQHTDWSYEDKGLIVDLSEASGSKTFTVFSIRAMDPCTLKTKRGITVGSSKDDVLAKYDKEYNAEGSDDSTLVLGSVYGGIIITLDGDKVAEIFIGASAE